MRCQILVNFFSRLGDFYCIYCLLKSVLMKGTQRICGLIRLNIFLSIAFGNYIETRSSPKQDNIHQNFLGTLLELLLRDIVSTVISRLKNMSRKYRIRNARFRLMSFKRFTKLFGDVGIAL